MPISSRGTKSEPTCAQHISCRPSGRSLATESKLVDCLLPFGEDEPPAPKKKDWREIKAAGDAWAEALNNRQKTPAHRDTTRHTP